jgi:hypothetical protein
MYDSLLKEMWGYPPIFKVMDDQESDIEFSRWWEVGCSNHLNQCEKKK